jgi:hypothetical protein
MDRTRDSPKIKDKGMIVFERRLAQGINIPRNIDVEIFVTYQDESPAAHGRNGVSVEGS